VTTLHGRAFLIKKECGTKSVDPFLFFSQRLKTWKWNLYLISPGRMDKFLVSSGIPSSTAGPSSSSITPILSLLPPRSSITDSSLNSPTSGLCLLLLLLPFSSIGSFLFFIRAFSGVDLFSSLISNFKDNHANEIEFTRKDRISIFWKIVWNQSEACNKQCWGSVNICYGSGRPINF